MTELNEVLQETLQETLARRDIRLVLASASPRRRELFHQAGLFPEIIPSHKEERSAAKTPAALVKALSRTKAEDIAGQLAGETAGGKEILVAGADTIVVLDGKVLGKPKDPEDAVRMLESLSGRAHHVYTGVTLILLGENDFTAKRCISHSKPHLKIIRIRGLSFPQHPSLVLCDRYALRRRRVFS